MYYLAQMDYFTTIAEIIMTEKMNVESALQSLNMVNNEVYTKIIDRDMKPNILAVYDEMKKLVEYGQDVWYGDADVYVSIEEAYEKYGEKFDVLIIRNVVSCCDLPYVFAIINTETRDIPLCKAVAPQGKKNDYTFGDHRDWALHGLDTLREHNWSFGYNDLRDDGLVFELNPIWAELKPEKAYNGWNKWNHGCGFHVEYLLYAQREIQYAFQMICEVKDYTIE